MSRILRRPMFRGGPVSSYGTGIASGLADGGRVGYNQAGMVTGKDLMGFRSSPSYNPKDYKFYKGGDDKRYVTDFIPKSAEDLATFQKRSQWEVPTLEDIENKIQSEIDTVDLLNLDQLTPDREKFIETQAGQDERRNELLAERATQIDQMKEFGIVVPGEGHPSEGIDATWSSKEPIKGVEEVKKVEEVNQNGNKIIETEESYEINADDVRAQAALFNELLNEDYKKEKKSAQIGDASDYALKFFESTVGQGKGMKEAAGDVAGFALSKPSKTETVKAGQKKTKQTATVMAINEALASNKSDRELDKMFAKMGFDEQMRTRLLNKRISLELAVGKAASVTKRVAADKSGDSDLKKLRKHTKAWAEDKEVPLGSVTSILTEKKEGSDLDIVADLQLLVVPANKNEVFIDETSKKAYQVVEDENGKLILKQIG